MLAVILGLIVVILSGWGIITWRTEFLTIMKGFVPFMFMVGGLIAIVAGATSVVESFEKKPEEETEAQSQEKTDK